MIVLFYEQCSLHTSALFLSRNNCESRMEITKNIYNVHQFLFGRHNLFGLETSKLCVEIAEGPQPTTLHHNDLITLWTMCVTFKCTQSIVVCLISDFEVAVYNILLPITCLVLEGEGKTWRTPESLEKKLSMLKKVETIFHH